MQQRVRVGYAVKLNNVLYTEGQVADLTADEARMHAHKLEPIEDAAMRATLDVETKRTHDAEARAAADAKYDTVIEHLRTRMVADILRTNPKLAQAIAEAWMARQPVQPEPTKKLAKETPHVK
jgi:hypothetical protein